MAALICKAIGHVFCGKVPCCQCLTPCGCANRKVFYNFDGSVSVEPLVSYFKPTNSIARENLIKGMKLDKDVLRKGLTAPEQIAAVIQFAHKKQYSARAVGAGCSWSKLTPVRDILIDMKNLNQILDGKPQNSVSSVFHIEVQSGMVFKDFFREIDRRYGMALPTSTAYQQQTVGGIVSTSSHGTGKDNQSLSNCIVRLHMIIAKGIQIKIRLPRKEEVDEDFESVKCKIEAAEYGDPPLEICSTDIFRAAALGLGSLGVIYSVTFECIAVYNVKEKRRNIEIKWPSKKQSKKFKLPSELKDLYSDPSKYVTILVNPYPGESDEKPGQAVLKSAYFVGKRTDEETAKLCKCNFCFTECQCYQCCTYNPDCRCLVCETDCCTNLLQPFTYCFPSWIPTLADCGLKLAARVQDTPNVDTWYKVFDFYEGRDNLHWRQAAYFVPLCELERALADVVELMKEYLAYRIYTLIPIYVRMVKADDLYLSPANRNRCDGTIVENYAVIEVKFPMGTYGVDEFHKKLEEHLSTQYKARPHWGQNLFLNLDKVDQLYPDLDKWKRIYLLFNSDGTFDNEFTRMVGFENFRGTAGCRTNVHVCHSSCPEHAIHLTTISGQEHHVSAVSAEAQHEISVNAHQVTTVTAELHDDHAHVNASSSKIIYAKVRSSKVVSSQPKRSNDLPRNTNHDGRNHFIPVPLHRR